DPEVPQPEQPRDVNDVVDSANAGLADAAAAGAEVRGEPDEAVNVESNAVDSRPVDLDAVDPDLAAFEEAEKSHPGTFATPELNEPSDSFDERSGDRADGPAATTGLFAADRASTSDTDLAREDSIADTA